MSQDLLDAVKRQKEAKAVLSDYDEQYQSVFNGRLALENTVNEAQCVVYNLLYKIPLFICGACQIKWWELDGQRYQESDFIKLGVGEGELRTYQRASRSKTLSTCAKCREVIDASS